MKNTNNLLNSIGGNYMEGMEEYWRAHYRSYVLNMSTTRGKRITFFEK